MHGHFNLPPFGIIEKTRIKIKGNRVFATTTSWVMVKNQPVIHLSIGTIMRLAIRNYTQKTETNNKARQSNKAKPNHKSGNQNKSNIYKQSIKTMFQEARWFKNGWDRVHMGENKRGPGDLKELKA